MSDCYTSNGRGFILPTGERAIESSFPIDVNYTAITGNRTDISRESGVYAEIFSVPYYTGTPINFWIESFEQTISQEVFYWNYEIPSTGVALGFLSGIITGIVTGEVLVSGFLSGFSEATGQIENFNITGYFGIENSPNTFNTSQQITVDTYATGSQYYFFSGRGQGFGSISGFSGLIFSDITGETNFNSTLETDRLNINNNLSGLQIGGVSGQISDGSISGFGLLLNAKEEVGSFASNDYSWPSINFSVYKSSGNTDYNNKSWIQSTGNEHNLILIRPNKNITDIPEFRSYRNGVNFGPNESGLVIFSYLSGRSPNTSNAQVLQNVIGIEGLEVNGDLIFGVPINTNLSFGNRSVGRSEIAKFPIKSEITGYYFENSPTNFIGEYQLSRHFDIVTGQPNNVLDSIDQYILQSDSSLGDILFTNYDQAFNVSISQFPGSVFEQVKYDSEGSTPLFNPYNNPAHKFYHHFLDQDEDFIYGDIIYTSKTGNIPASIQEFGDLIIDINSTYDNERLTEPNDQNLIFITGWTVLSDLFTGFFTDSLTPTGFTEKSLTGGVDVSFIGNGTGFFYGTGSLTGSISGLSDDTSFQIFEFKEVITGIPIDVNLANPPCDELEISETGVSGISFPNPFYGNLNENFSSDLTTQTTFITGIFPKAWTSYETTGINNNICSALGIKIRELDNIPLRGESTSINPTKIAWSGINNKCLLSDFSDFLKDLLGEESTEEEQQQLCNQICGEEIPLDDGGGSDGGGPDSGGSTDVSFILYSGQILLNQPQSGDEILFKNYNFNYTGQYQNAYKNDPLYPQVDLSLKYNIDFNNTQELTEAINNKLNIDQQIWQFFKTTISEYSGTTTGDYSFTPLLKAQKLNNNVISISSLIYGEMGNYSWQVIQSGESTGDFNGTQYKVPKSLKLQASNDNQSWNNLLVTSDIDWSNSKIFNESINESNDSNDLHIEIGNNFQSTDYYKARSFNNFLTSGNQNISGINNDSIILDFIDDTNSLFDSVTFPITGFDISSLSFTGINLQISDDNGLNTFNYLGKINFLGIKDGITLEENGNQPIQYFEECGETYTYTTTISTVISSGFDESGRYFEITNQENILCTGCQDRILVPIPLTNPVQSGWVDCDKEGGEKGTSAGKIELVFTGLITGVSGTDFTNLNIINNDFLSGNIIYDQNPENINQNSTTIGVYPIKGIKLNINDIDFSTVEYGEENPIITNLNTVSVIEYRTGYQFLNQTGYDYYRLLASGFENQTSYDGYFSGESLYFREINLYNSFDTITGFTGVGEFSLYDASFSGDLQVFTTGIITGIDSGISPSGIIVIDGAKTGILSGNEVFFNGTGYIPVNPFGTKYENRITGSGDVFYTQTGYLYNPETQELFYSQNFSGNITGNGLITGTYYEVTDLSLIQDFIDGQFFVEKEATTNFTGQLEGFQYFDSGIDAIFYQTGLQSTTVFSGSGSHIFSLSLTGNPTETFITDPTGFINGNAIIDFNFPLNNDGLIIDSNTFTKNNNLNFLPPDYFTGLSDLVSIINSGQYNFKANQINNDLYLYSTLSGSGSSGQAISIFGGTGRPILFANQFTGGQDILKAVSGYGNYIGDFSGAVDNTGIYNTLLSGEVTGIINMLTGFKTFKNTWNLFTGKYFKEVNFFTGIQDDSSQYTGISVNFGKLPGVMNAFVTYIPFTNDSGVNNVAQLFVTGENMSGFFVNITGEI